MKYSPSSTTSKIPFFSPTIPSANRKEPVDVLSIYHGPTMPETNRYIFINDTKVVQDFVISGLAFFLILPVSII